MRSIEEEIAEILLDIKAVHIDPSKPFTWASGVQSPIYCDNRQIISYPAHRNSVAEAFALKIKNQFEGTYNVIAGTATAGIPHAAWVAEELDRYISAGYKTFILDVPPDEEELHYTTMAFEHTMKGVAL